MMLFFFLLSYTIADIDVDAKWADHGLIIEASGMEVGGTFEDDQIRKAIENLSKLRLCIQTYLSSETSSLYSVLSTFLTVILIEILPVIMLSKTEIKAFKHLTDS